MNLPLTHPTRPIIDGLNVTTGNTFWTVRPSSGEPFAEIHRAGKREIDAAVAAARKAFLHWGKRPVRERQKHLANLLEVVRKNHDDLARLIAAEQGKPIAEARAIDLVPGADALRYYSRFTEELLSPKAIDYEQILFAHKMGQFRFEPLGVVAVITPWNFPFAIPMVEIAAALAAGNTVVFKPASATAVIGLTIGELCRKAGLPPGVVNVVPCSGADTDHLVDHPDVAKILFTGSVEIGRRVMERASRNLTGCVLELGGKDPAIVCADADLDRTAAGIVWGAFTNAGQACGSIERVYVMEEVAEEFIRKVVEKTQELRMGDPSVESTDMGPMTTLDQRDFVDAQVREAIGQGAKALTGGEKPATKGFWMPPTVLVKVDHSMRVMTEETFGPVLPIMPVESLEQAVKLANDSEYGLTASAWTTSPKTAERLASELVTGTVTINDHLFSFGEPSCTWGGLKKSGLGRSHSVYGLLELVNIKHVSMDLADATPAPWWYPYDSAFQKFIQRAFGALYTNDPKTKLPDALGLMSSGRFFGYVKVSKIASKLGKMF